MLQKIKTLKTAWEEHSPYILHFRLLKCAFVKKKKGSKLYTPEILMAL